MKRIEPVKKFEYAQIHRLIDRAKPLFHRLFRTTLIASITLVALPASGLVPLPLATSQEYSTKSTNLYAQELIDNLNILKHTFRVKYAPKKWKFELTGWDLNKQIAKAKKQTHEADHLDLNACRQIVTEFINSCSDYHVRAKFYSTAYSYLPFRVKSSQGRFFVSWIDEMLLWGRGLDLEVGDELLYFNGQPVDEVVGDIQSRYYERGMPATDRALAEISLTLRLGAEGMIPEQGEASIEVRRHGRPLKGNLEWLYGNEEISPPYKAFDRHLQCNENASIEHQLPSIFYKEMKTPLFESLVEVCKRINLKRCDYHDVVDEDFIPLGSFKSYVPILGKILWKSPHPTTFNAYIFEHPTTQKPIGYVRIPSFDTEKKQPYREFGQLIKEFEASTDALVIDQNCNPGGDLFYTYAIASMLTNKPLSVPTHAITISQAEVREALNFLDKISQIDCEETAKDYFGNTVSGYNVDLTFIEGAKTHFQFVVDQWNAGRHITKQFPLFGIKTIQPHHSATYSKPILMLIDSLDFSAADFLPAILQDNQQATLFGVKTSGAGGYVERFTYSNLLGIDYFTCTASFAKRQNKQPLENLGVSPDILYEVSPLDLQNNYTDYAAAVNEALESL